MQKSSDICRKKTVKLCGGTPGVKQFGLKHLSPSFSIGTPEGTALSIYCIFINIYTYTY